MATKEILLRGPDEQAAYARARDMARTRGVPIGTVLALSVEALEREELASKRRSALLQEQRDTLRSKRRGM